MVVCLSQIISLTNDTILSLELEAEADISLITTSNPDIAGTMKILDQASDKV
jgi:hypothetical protein